MSTITKPNPVELMLVKYSIADKQIAELREEYKGLSVVTKEGYESVRLAIATTRKCRVEIDKQRKLFKEDALCWGRKVDAEAKRLTGLLEAIEDPLQAAKDEVDIAKERERQEKIDAEMERQNKIARAKREAEETERRKLREAEEAVAKAEREAEDARLKAENLRMAEERKKFEAEQRAFFYDQEKERSRLAEEDRIRNVDRLKERERLAEEQAKLDVERLAVDAERQRLQLVESKRLEKLRQSHEERERAERERVEAEAERLRVEAMRPDVDKIHAFGGVLREIMFPRVESQKAKAFLKQINIGLEELADCCEAFEA